MSEIPLGHEYIDYLIEKINDLSVEELEKIATSNTLNEVVFNVIQYFTIEIKKGKKLDDETIKKLKFLAHNRMKYLKPKFDSGPADRTYPGKMEYDTTLEVLRMLDVALAS